MAPKRRVDLGVSAAKKLLRCEKYLEEQGFKEYNPKTCLEMMKNVCEKRNAALKGIWDKKNVKGILYIKVTHYGP